MAEFDREAYRREQQIDAEGKEFAEMVSNFVNGMDRNRQAKAIEHMMRDHRTLQQSTMRFFVSYCEAMAKQGHDLRNEGAVNLAKEIVKLNTGLAYI